jgi:hypothetical protein
MFGCHTTLALRAIKYVIRNSLLQDWDNANGLGWY